MLLSCYIAVTDVVTLYAGRESMISNAESWKEPVRTPSPATSWLFQVRVLLVRNVRMWYRTPTLLFGFFAQYIFAGIFIGECHMQTCKFMCSFMWRKLISFQVYSLSSMSYHCVVQRMSDKTLRKHKNRGVHCKSWVHALSCKIYSSWQACDGQ